MGYHSLYVGCCSGCVDYTSSIWAVIAFMWDVTVNMRAIAVTMRDVHHLRGMSCHLRGMLHHLTLIPADEDEELRRRSKNGENTMMEKEAKNLDPSAEK